MRGGVHGVDVDAGAGLVARPRRSRAMSGTVPTALLRRGDRDPARALAEHAPRSRAAAARACRGRARRSAPSRPRARRRSPTGARWRRGPAACRRPRRRAAACARRRPRSASSARSCSGRRRRRAGRRRAARRRRRAPAATSSSVACAAAKTPPWLALPPERTKSAMASIAASTICVPAGPSRRAQPSFKPGKRSRFIRSAPPHAGRSRPCASPRGAGAAPDRVARMICRDGPPSASFAHGDVVAAVRERERGG